MNTTSSSGSPPEAEPLWARTRASLARRFLQELRQSGARAALRRVFRWVDYKVRSRLGILDPVHTHRIELAKRLDAQFGSTVRYGPFAGLRLPSSSWWGYTSRGAMLLGIYEREVLESLARKPATYRIFIDVGAADGYYAIGALVSGLFDRTYCFEASERGREVIGENAARAGLADRLVVNGIAQHDFLDRIPVDELASAVVLMDIEGGEFSLLTRENLERLRRSIVLVELHEWRLEDGSHRLQELLDASQTTHSVSRLTTTSRDLSVFPELREMSDTDRWLVCSEGRERLMTWLRLDPL